MDPNEKTPAAAPGTVDPAEVTKVDPPAGEAPQGDKPTEGVESEAPKTDTPAAEAKAAGKFAKLSKKERELKAKEDEIARREAALSARENEKKEPTAEELRAAAKKNPKKFMEDYGITYDELTNFILAGGQEKVPDKADEALTAVQKLEKKIQEEKEAAEKEENERTDAFIAKEKQKYRTLLDEHLRENADTYELIVAHNANGVVFNVIEEYFMEHGKVLDFDTAAEWVEKYYEAEAKKIIGAKKISSLLPSKESVEGDPGGKKTSTLTNAATVVAGSKDGRLLPREESLKRMSSMLKFN